MLKPTLSEIFIRNSHQFQDLTSDKILFLLSKDGEFLEISGKRGDYEGQYDLANELILKKKNISAIFDIPAIPLSQLINGQYYPVRFFPVEVSEGLDSYYSLTPMLWISIVANTEYGFLGVITMPRLLPNLLERFTGGIFFINRENRLVLFNKSFFNHFHWITKNPFELLDRDVDDLFEMSPCLFQKAAINEGIKDIPTLNNTLINFTLPDKNALWDRSVFVNGGTTLPTNNALSWTAEQEHESYITFVKSYSFEKAIYIKFSGYFNANSIPSVLLGDLEETNLLRDANGYLVGPSFDGKDIFLKKGGYVIGSNPLTYNIKPSNLTIVELIKADRLFIYKINGQSILEYFDYDALDRNATWISLYIRKGISCSLKSVEINFSESTCQSHKDKIFTQLKNKPDNAFLINRLYSPLLAYHPAKLEAYRLQDVTDFQTRVKTLEGEYLKVMEKGRRLSRLVSRYRQETPPLSGNSKQIVQLKDQADIVARGSTTVLIQGETGCGKEVLAHYIHSKSDYRSGPFVKVDCATIASSLMESILFGHEKGAFTGATSSSRGLFEQADGGTIFLDEINNLTYETQAKLLRFLSDKSIIRLGGQKTIPLNLRIIAATNIPLLSLVRLAKFREDLYYRLAVACFNIPPLRDRMEDITVLSNQFLIEQNESSGRNIRGFTPEAISKLFGHSWPGNIRELKNVIERAAIFCTTEMINDIDIEISKNINPGRLSKSVRRKPSTYNKDEILEEVKKHGGNIKATAETLNISRRTLYYLFEKFNITH